MATGEQPQKHLLTLIREFATERSHGERRVSDLKKRLLIIESDTAAATAALDSAKRSKESAEQQLKGFQVHLSMTDASILAQQARFSLLQEEVSKVGAELAAMKAAEGVQRDEFIGAMYDINREIRQFRDSTVTAFWKQYDLDLPSDNGKIICNEVLNVQDDQKCLEDEITSINAQLDKVEEEYRKELRDHDEVRQALMREESRVFFVEAVMEETKQLQELARLAKWRRHMPPLARSCKRVIHAPSVSSIIWEKWRKPLRQMCKTYFLWNFSVENLTSVKYMGEMEETTVLQGGPRAGR